MSRLVIAVLGISAVAFAVTITGAETSPWRPLPPAGETVAEAEGGGKPESPFKDWDEVLKDAESFEGVFTLHKKREELFLELTPEHFENDYLIALSIGQGIGARFLLGGLPWGTKLVNFRRVEDHIQLVEPNTRFVSSSDPARGNAVGLSFGPSVLASFEIESERDSTAVLVNLDRFLLSDYPDLAFFLGLVLDTGVSLDGSRSRVAAFKNFPENLEFDVEYSFSPMSRRELYVQSVIDNRYIPVTIHYSIRELPHESDYVPRLADSRVGYFLTAQKDFSRGDERGYFRRYVNRWHLQKKDPHRLLSEPVEPIVYYVDRTIPEEYRQFVREGIEAWQPAFEAAGFKNAIVARDYPEDDPDFDPEDARYSSIRWITSDQPSFAAIGPSRVDPRTGQILDADILIEDSFVQSIKNGYTRLVETRDLATASDFPAALLDPEIRMLMETPGVPEDVRTHICAAGAGVEQSAALVGLSLLAQGRIAPGEDVPIEYVGEALRWVVMHEVGHTLGLRHNFKSSIDVPFEELNDRSYVAEHGMTGSVMDYAPANIALDPDDQGYYYGPGLGTYDYWAIRYGYTPFGSEEPDGDWSELERIADESNRPGHTYATDEDTYSAWAPDPTSNIFDLSGDPLAFAIERCELTDRLIRSPRFEEMIMADGDGFPKLRRAMTSILYGRFAAVTAAYKYLGGAYIARDHKGTPDARPPISPIPGDEQRRALRFIFARAFQDETFAVPPRVLDRLGIDRWSHWGTSSFGSRFEFPIHEWASLFQGATVYSLLTPTRLARMQEAEYKYPGTVTMAELFGEMTDEVWRELGSNDRSISSFRRGLQRIYLGRLIELTLNPPTGLPDDARALARLHLGRIDERIQRFTRAGSTDDVVAAHLELARAQIKQALEARMDTRL